ncbi:katanin p60 ATPase-containing subunit A-like 2 [Gadus chalcogrammus]|uniref:katanin p60 ATPase-containing subunit A-like 2 n=1 Tax=Gadus chalcogrammus TaxID=1042646 RepID=UPI0024C47F13|nr:katanin p60 ATPase-containing subunit A-like 2 [Gadus chalcogrammus]
MELSYQSMRTAHQVREAEELRTETRKKDLLILIYHHLMDHGYMDSAGVLDGECNGGLQRLEVCDNVDLETVLMEYQTYHYIKFNKYPRLTRRSPPTVETRQVSSCGKKRSPSSTVKPLPKISPTHRPHSGGGARNSEPHIAIRNRSENGLVDPTLEFGLNVSSFANNGASGEGSSRKLKDNKAVIQDASRRGNADTDHAERLLKPLGAFITTSSEMRELAAIISKDIYVHNPNVHWDDIMGLEDGKRLVKEAVVYPIKYPQLFTGILSPWKGLLLYGPPGTGKTLLAKAVATECSTTFFNISASTIISKWRGDSEKLIRVLFELAKFHAPSTIFLDELESVMGQRGGGHGGEHEGSRRMKTELLIQMDGLAASDHLVFILAASNMPWELDQAMLRRLEKRILIGLPSEPARQAMISHWLPPVSLSGGAELRTQLDYEQLAKEAAGYSGSDLRLVCKEAAMRPVRKILHTLETPGNSHLPVINLETVTTEDFLEVMTHTKPSAGTLTHRYTEWERDYQSV